MNTHQQDVLLKLDIHQEEKDLELLVMDACKPENCLFISNRTLTGAERMLLEDLAPGTYYIVVDGYIESTSPYTIEIECTDFQNGNLTCNAIQTVNCNTTTSGDTRLGTNQTLQYACNNYYYPGKELIYQFSVDSTSEVEIRLTGIEIGEDLDLYLLESCDKNSCIKSSTRTFNEEEGLLIERAVAGRNYYLVVDGYNGSESTFNLELRCYGYTQCTRPEGCPPFQLRCDENEIVCDQIIEGNTADGRSEVDIFSCKDAYTSGRELIYQFHNETAQDIKIRLFDLEDNLDLYLLDACSRHACIATSNKSLTFDEAMTFEPLPAGDYFIVVDGYNRAQSTFKLLVECNPTENPCDSIQLDSGLNFISFCRLLNRENLVEIFRPVKDYIKTVQNQELSLYTPFNTTELPLDFQWDITQGLRVTTFCDEPLNDPTLPKPVFPLILEVCPTAEVPDSISIPLRADLQNYVGYFKAPPQKVSQTFAGVSAFLSAKKNVNLGNCENKDSLFIAPPFSGPHDFLMQKGEGYYVNVIEDIDWGYSTLNSSVISSERNTNVENKPKTYISNKLIHFKTQYQRTTNLSSLIFSKVLLQNYLNDEDEIGAFSENGQLYGSGKYDKDAEGLAFVLLGDNLSTPDKEEGFKDGETIHLKIWNSTNKQVRDMLATYHVGGTHYRHNFPLIIKELAFLSSQNQEHISEIDFTLYPNPVSHTLNTSIQLPETTTVELSIYAINGQQLKSTIYNNLRKGNHHLETDVKTIPAGVYLLEMKTSKQLITKKIIIQ